MHQIFRPHRSLPTPSPLHLPTSLDPIYPTPGVAPNILPPGILRQPRRRPTPHTRFTIEYQRNITGLLRHAEPKPIFKLFGREVECFWGGSYGDILRGGNMTCCLEFAGFADVD